MEKKNQTTKKEAERKAKGVPGQWDIHAQMKLVEPDSEEAREFP